MKNLIQKTALMLIFLTITVGQTHTGERPRGTRKKVVAQESPAAKVSTQVDLLDQIVKQIDIIAKPGISTAEQSKAKTELNKLMKDKSLDARVKDVISKDISILTASKARRVSEADHQKSMKDARDRLIAAINSIIAQANVVEVMEEGTTKVDLATTPEAKDQSIKENIQNVQIAQAKADEASMMNRIIAGVKTTVSMPGDYIFGPERTKAKTAFEATVGAAVLGALAYLSYTYAPGAMEYVKDLYGRFMGTGAEGQKFELSPRQKEKLGAFSEAVYSEGKTIPEYPGTTPSERELRAGEQITAAVEQAVQAVSESEIAKALLDAQERAVKALSESPTAQRRIEAVGRGGEIIPETGRSVGAFYEWTPEEIEKTRANLKLLAEQGREKAAELYQLLFEKPEGPTLGERVREAIRVKPPKMQ